MDRNRVARRLLKLASDLEGGSGRRTARDRDVFDVEKEVPPALKEAYDLLNAIVVEMESAIDEVPGAEKAARAYEELMNDMNDVIREWESLPRVDSWWTRR